MKRSSSAAYVGSLVGVLWLGCEPKDSSDSETEAYEVESGTGECIPSLGEAPIAHACSHGNYGTPTVVVATAAGDGAPDVSGSHVIYDVQLASAGGLGWTSVLPMRAGEHAVMLSVDLPVRVSTATGDVAVESVAADLSCDAFKVVRLVNLVAGEPHWLTLGPTTEPSVALYFEHLGTFGDDVYEQMCSSK